jgi:hypothetical protein
VLTTFRFSIGSIVTNLCGCPNPLCIDHVPNDPKVWLHGHT